MTPVRPNGPTYAKGASLVAFLTALIILVANLADFGWSGVQIVAVTGLVDAAVFLVVVIVVDTRPGSTEEKVALGGTVTALVTAVVGVILAFGWWGLEETDGAAIVTVAGLGVTAVGTFFGRKNVTADVTPLEKAA